MKLLVSATGRVFYVKSADQDYHTQFGFVKKEDLKGAVPGQAVKTSLGKELFVLDAGFADQYARIRRGPQIIPLKDLGPVIAVTGIGKDSVVIDAGTGSGAAACFLARVAGHVYSYEIREDFHRIAEANVKLLGLKNITLHLQDAKKGFREKNADLVLLDMPDPWECVAAAKDALAVGGFLASYSPTTPQVADFVKAVLATPGLIHVKTVEVIEREWEVSERKVRPRSAAIGHSGFLTFARKIATG